MADDQTRGLPGVWRAPKELSLTLCLAAAALCIALAFGTGNMILESILLVCGLTLAFFSIAVAFREKRIVKTSAQLDTTVSRLMTEDADNVFLTSAAGQISFANKAAIARFGHCKNEQLGVIFGDMLANPNGVLSRLVGKVEKGGASKEDIVTRNGHYRLSVSAVGEDRLLWRLDDLGENRSQSNRTNEAATLPFIQVDDEDNVVQINDAARLLLGKRPSVLSDAFEDLPLRSGQTRQITTEDDVTEVMIAETASDKGGRDIYLIPVSVAADAPRQLEAGWDAIEDLPVPLLKIAAEGRVLASNREARQLLHIDDTDGCRLGDILDGLGRPINDWLREACEGRGGQASQFLKGRGKNQDTFVQITLNTAGKNDDAHLIAVLNDVTELKTLEAQFVQSQKMQAIGQLAGGVAHDFNNLLTAISGHCDLLLLRHNEGDQNYGDLIQIHQNANRAASLVGQLLAFSRKQTLQLEIIDLRDTLSDLTHLLNRLVGEKVTLSLHHDPSLAQIKADKRQLEQVLMNLVVNARDAMDGAGDINVVTENLTLKKQLVRDRAKVPPGDYVVVKVIDEGQGIPVEKLQKIFEPFVTTKRPGEGTGLGLSTAYGIVKQTGGYIFVESEVGKGSQFSLLFPSHHSVEKAVKPVKPVENKMVNMPGDGVVLLVEDEAPVRAFASRALRLRGYTVLEADCAEAALELLEDDELHVDLFVTDVIMPGKDGPTWVREALKQRGDTRVVFVSGYAEDAFGDDQAEIPNSVFLPKPFSLNALTQTVHEQLNETVVPA